MQLILSHSHVSPEMLLRMCRASPKLRTLYGPKNVYMPDTTIAAISATCPELISVSLSQVGKNYSPAETWAHHFPRLGGLKLSRDGSLYLPTQLDAIRNAALTCRHATGLEIDGCYITAAVIDAIVGTPVGDRLSALDDIDDEATNIEPAAFLAAARGFPELDFLVIPSGSRMGGPHFYIDLSRTTARITSLEIHDFGTTDACIAAACSHLHLEWLELHELDLLTSSIVDGITRSQSTATLSHLKIAYCAQLPERSPLRAADMLRLVRGCPELDTLDWRCNNAFIDYAQLDRGTCQAIIDLLKSRDTTVYCDYFGQLDAGVSVPNCIFAC